MNEGERIADRLSREAGRLDLERMAATDKGERGRLAEVADVLRALRRLVLKVRGNHE